MRPLCQSVVSKFTAFVVLTGTDAQIVRPYSGLHVTAIVHRGFNGDGRPPTRYYPCVPTLFMQNYLVMGLPKQKAVAVGLAMSLFFRNLPLPLKTYVFPPILNNSYKFENHADIV